MKDYATYSDKSKDLQIYDTWKKPSVIILTLAIIAVLLLNLINAILLS